MMISASNLPALASGVLALLTLHFLYRRFTNSLAHLPGPEISKWTDLIYKYYWFIGKAPFYVHSLHERYGPIVRTGPSRVDICDIDAVKEIHRHNTRFLKSEWYTHLVGGAVTNMFTASDPHFHSLRRRLLASPISDSSLMKFEPLISSRVRLAVDKMAEEMQNRDVADVFKWWLFMATDIIGELSFGESFRMLEAGKKNQYTTDLENLASLQPLRTTFPGLLKVGKYVPLPMFKKAAEMGKRVGMYGFQSLQRYKKHVEENPTDPKPTLFTKIADQEKSSLTWKDIQDEAQGYIVAGSDTTAVTLTYLVHAVSQDTRVRDKLVAELSALPEPVSYKDLRDLPYLNQVINETLRLYTAVPFGLPRLVPPEGAQFNGFYLPSKTTVSTQSYSLHRDPAIFSDPDSFNPERWEHPTKEMKEASLPFGGGSRICIGIHLAHFELRMATATFFRKFPQAQPSQKEGMSSHDMAMKSFFLMAPQGHRCLLEA